MSQGPVYIITEPMKYGSLLDYVRGDGCSLKLPELIDRSETGHGRPGYIHRNLVARTALVGEDNICKVANFELAHLEGEGI